MKKYCLDLKIVQKLSLSPKTVLLKLTAETPLPTYTPGQFAELLIEHTPQALLRRPVSIHFMDKERNELWFLIQIVGRGTAYIATLRSNENINVLMPLGKGFTLPGEEFPCSPLLVGGGVGCAPLLYLCKLLKEKGHFPDILLGARSASDVVELEEFTKYGTVYVTTEDGSMGTKGFVTNHPILSERRFDRIYSCGPKPMMTAVARYAKERSIWCEVSLENRMACGLGACLCCVEMTRDGHKCVCSDGPVFNMEELLWLS